MNQSVLIQKDVHRRIYQSTLDCFVTVSHLAETSLTVGHLNGGHLRAGHLEESFHPILSTCSTHMTTTAWPSTLFRYWNVMEYVFLYLPPPHPHPHSLLLLFQTLRTEGIGALYKGFIPSYLRIGPWNIIVSSADKHCVCVCVCVCVCACVRVRVHVARNLGSYSNMALQISLHIQPSDKHSIR
jgi:hypothetical protein